MMAGVNAVLPPIALDTGASAKELSLLTTFYALGLAIFQLTTGRMGDIWGRRRVFLSGMALFIITSLLLGLTSNILIMQALRLVQGAGAAIFTSSSLAILTETAPEGKRGQYISYSAFWVYIGIACGPPLAGIIADSIGWRWIFWSNAIAAILSWCLMFFVVRGEWYQGKGEPFDWRGGMVYAAGMSTLVIGSTILQTQGLNGGVLMLAGLILLILYVFLETRTKYPLLDINLFRSNRVFALSSLAAFVNYSAFFGMIFFFSLYLQAVRGLSLKDAGLFLSIQFIVQSILTPIGGRLADKYRPERISAIGIALCGVGLFCAAFLGKDTPLTFFILPQVILGTGVALFAAPNTTVIMTNVDKAHVGQAAGIVGTMRTSGALVNSTIMSITLGYFLGQEAVSSENIDGFLMSMRVDLIIFGIFNLAAIGCALARNKK